MLSFRLKQARIESGKSIEEVASYLKIKKQYLVAIEEEQFDLLPAAVYTKGYLKLYAKYLGLSLNEQKNHTIEFNQEAINRINESDCRYVYLILKHIWQKRIILSLIFLVILSIIFYLMF